jgi:hypothetical protein
MNKAMQIKSKIKNLALKNHVPAQAVLQNFMLERLLERISISKYKEMIILKGGMLIASMVGINSRTTMDMDATLRVIKMLSGIDRSGYSNRSHQRPSNLKEHKYLLDNRIFVLLLSQSYVYLGSLHVPDRLASNARPPNLSCGCE